MTQSNINLTHTKLVNRDETDQVYIDGDSTEAIFRAMVDPDRQDEFEQFVDELAVDVERTKYVGFGVEVTLR
jgi:DNA-dependent RNA polymerase auxiliary subunit epsilon